jgi:acyl dehydratase
MTIRTVEVEALAELVGQEVGLSDWIDVDQGRIDAFADITEDRQFIHVSPEAAAATPFGGTIAHGFLTLSLLSRMAETAIPRVADAAMGVNYGFERVRFLTPVRSGARIRARFVLNGAEEKGSGRWLLTWQVTVEIEAVEKPALVADWLTMQILG